MIVKLLTEHHLECLSIKGGCRGLSESTHVKMPHCWKSHALAQIRIILSIIIFYKKGSGPSQNKVPLQNPIYKLTYPLLPPPHHHHHPPPSRLQEDLVFSHSLLCCYPMTVYASSFFQTLLNNIAINKILVCFDIMLLFSFKLKKK